MEKHMHSTGCLWWNISFLNSARVVFHAVVTLSWCIDTRELKQLTGEKKKKDSTRISNPDHTLSKNRDQKAFSGEVFIFWHEYS